MRTRRCPRQCPHTWDSYEPVRTPGDVKAMRVILYVLSAITYLAAVWLSDYASMAVPLYFLATLVALAGHGQTLILRSFDAHPEHERTER